jgi:hypothetical protein
MSIKRWVIAFGAGILGVLVLGILLGDLEIKGILSGTPARAGEILLIGLFLATLAVGIGMDVRIHRARKWAQAKPILSQPKELDQEESTHRSIHLPGGGYLLIEENQLGLNLDLLNKERKIFDRVAVREETLIFDEARTQAEIEAVVAHLREVAAYLPVQARQALSKIKDS